MPSELRISGLQTLYNELSSTRPGALIEAINIVIDKNNIAEPRRGFGLYGSPFGVSADKAHQLFNYKNRLLIHDGNKLSYDDGTGNFVPFTGTYNEIDNGRRLRSQEVNSNLYFTSKQGIQKLSANSASHFNVINPRLAGGVKALDVIAKINYSTGNFLPPKHECAYRVVWGYKDNNENLILGAPSSRTVISNYDSTLSCGVDLTFQIPDEILPTDTHFFYQIYRSASVPISLTGGAGDEMNLIIEDYPTLIELQTIRRIDITDITPDSFRESGTLLYTNPVSGEGILQANLPPPLAKDISLYNGHTFYANTQTKYNLNEDLIGVGGLVSGSSYIQILDGLIAHRYTFNGDVEKTKFTFDTKANTTDGSYFLLNSASNERKYFIWFDKTGTTIEPNYADTQDRIPIRVDISNLTSAIEIAYAVLNAIKTHSVAQYDFKLEDNFKYAKAIIQDIEYSAKTIGPIGNNINILYQNTESLSTASKVIQDLTYKAKKAGSEGNNITIHYINTGSGGLSVTENNNAVVVNFGGTTPTATQIQALTFSLVTVTISGTGSNIQTVFPTPLNLTGGTGGLKFTEVGNNIVVEFGGSNPRAKDIAGLKFTLVNTKITGNADTLQTVTSSPTYLINGEGYDYINIENIKNGNTIDSREGSIAVGGSFSIEIVNQGDGEDSGYFESVLYTLDGGASFTDLTSAAMVSGGSSYDVGTSSGGTEFFYIGKFDKQFNKAIFEITQAHTGTGVLKVEYFNGSNWVLATGISGDFNTIGTRTITWDYPSLMSKTTVNNINAYWARIFYDSGTVPTFVKANSTVPIPFVTITMGSIVSTEINPHVLLSNSLSISQQIEETSRSLVNIVQRNSRSPVYAYYLSGPNDTPGLMFFEAKRLNQNAFYLQADSNSTGKNFNAAIPTSGSSLIASNESRQNRIYFSKYQQPESVPMINYIDVGPKDKAIQRILALRDALFILKDDGVYRLTGQFGSFVVNLFDASANIVAPDTAVVLNNQIYMLSNQGIARVSDTGIGVISRDIDNLILKVISDEYNYQYTSFGVAYETDRAYLCFTPTNPTDNVATQVFRYNTFTNSWTIWEMSKKCGLVNIADDKLYLGPADINQIEQERKNFDRSDYCDRAYDLSIGENAVNNNILTLSSVSKVSKGDALVQTQYLTITQFNRILYLLDKDYFLNDTDYYDKLHVVSGDNLRNAIDNLAYKLDADIGRIAHRNPLLTTTYASLISTSTDFNTMQNEFNAIVNLLNNDLEGTFYKTYKQSNGTTKYIAQIDEVIKNTNNVILYNQMPFVVGPLVLYKGINTSIIWAANTFEDPSVYKQINEATVIFKGNNFNSCQVGYASDLSPSYELVTMKSVGPGNWGESTWGTQNWGGSGSEIPFRTYLPRNKQRCRFLRCQFKHYYAYEHFAILGISFNPRSYSMRAYK